MKKTTGQLLYEHEIVPWTPPWHANNRDLLHWLAHASPLQRDHMTRLQHGEPVEPPEPNRARLLEALTAVRRGDGGFILDTLTESLFLYTRCAEVDGELLDVLAANRDALLEDQEVCAILSLLWGEPADSDLLDELLEALAAPAAPVFTDEEVLRLTLVKWRAETPQERRRTDGN